MRRAIPRSVRSLVLRRAGRRCEYCKSLEQFSPDSFSIDHIVPISRDGGEDVENLAFSCQGCNASKQDAIDAVDPATYGIVPLFHPRRDRWENHFRWSNDSLQIEGVSATGRATALRLQLNREGVLN